MIYLFDYSKISIDSFMAFCLGILFAVTINAEAQAFIAQFLGDIREKDENRFHFNAFRHLDLAGTILFFITSFGWPKTVDIDSNKFKRPRFHTIIVRFAGPVANFFLASIISSISLIIEQFSIEAQMLQIVIGINLIVWEGVTLLLFSQHSSLRTLLAVTLLQVCCCWHLIFCWSRSLFQVSTHDSMSQS